MKTFNKSDAVAHDLLVPIATEAQYREALAAVNDLMQRVSVSSTQPQPLESLLGILIERLAAYEDAVLPRPAKRPEAVLAYLMQDRNLSQTALADATGINQSTLSKLFRAQRPLSKSHLQTLAAYFRVEPGVFL